MASSSASSSTSSSEANTPREHRPRTFISEEQFQLQLRYFTLWKLQLVKHRSVSSSRSSFSSLLVRVEFPDSCLPSRLSMRRSGRLRARSTTMRRRLPSSDAILFARPWPTTPPACLKVRVGSGELVMFFPPRLTSRKSFKKRDVDTPPRRNQLGNLDLS